MKRNRNFRLQHFGFHSFWKNLNFPSAAAGRHALRSCTRRFNCANRSKGTEIVNSIPSTSSAFTISSSKKAQSIWISSDIKVPLYNSGTLDVQTGALAVNGGGNG